mmetsp:Transcript_14243/g.38602  ORF Transcript_14243/g.38602 Transcript_14243/m.38602 type:complete len:236 (-) Transcript_14243:6258-6965(-)
MKLDATTTSPGRQSNEASYSEMDASQRMRSPARPVTSFSARSSLPSRSDSSSSNARLRPVLSSYLSFRDCTLASTLARASCAAASAACFLAKLSWAALSLARLGATSLATCPYVSMAWTHRHRPRAATDTLPTESAVKLGFVVNFPIFFSSASSSLSLSNSIMRFMKDGSPSCFLDSSQVAGRLNTVMTAFSVNSTRAGGLAYALSSLMSFLVNTFRASSAACRAGRALSSSDCT